MSAVVSDPVIGFRDAIERAGLTVPEHVVPDGELHRFASNGNRTDDSGWYVLHLDGLPAGSFGCWRSGLSQTWRGDITRELSDQEKREYKERVQAQRRAREAEATRRNREAAAKANEIWNVARPGDHPYLNRKGIKAHGVRVDGGRLVIPMRDASGKLTSLQFIDGDGNKKFLTGGKVSGAYHSIGKPDCVLCIAEGYATAASIHEATGYAAAVAFNAGNLRPVAMTLRRKYPDIRLVICADDDTSTEGNPGMTKATEAAKVANGIVAVPAFGDDTGTDFNDLHRLKGTDAVRQCIEASSMTEPPATGLRAVNIVRASDINPEPIDWRWHGWLAAAKLHILAGAPGTGKTTLALAFAAAVTTGGRWPDGTRAAQGNVLICSYEDDPADTLVPRLAAMGADLSRVYFLRGISEDGESRAFSAARDLSLLATRLDQIGNVTLVIVDPIVSAMGSVDSHKNLETRQALQPLADLAVRTRATLLGITHLAKGTGTRDPLERLIGSIAFGALARVVLGAAKVEDENGSNRVLARIKSNIGPDDGGFHYNLEPTTEGGIETVSVLCGSPLEGSARELLTSEDDADPTESRDAMSEAKSFLISILDNGTNQAKDIYREAVSAGISKRTLDRAKARLGIRARKDGKIGPWYWEFTDQKVANGNGAATEDQGLSPEHCQGRQPSGMATLATFDGEGGPDSAKTDGGCMPFREAF